MSPRLEQEILKMSPNYPVVPAGTIESKNYLKQNFKKPHNDRVATNGKSQNNLSK